MRNSTTRSLSCVGCLTLGPAGSALETAQAAANHLRGSLRQHCRRLPLVTICRTAGYALAAVRGSRKEVRVRDAHGHPGDRAGAATWIGDDLGGLPAFSPAVRYRVPGDPRLRDRLGRPAVSLGGTRSGRSTVTEPVRRLRVGRLHCLARGSAGSHGRGEGIRLATGGPAVGSGANGDGVMAGRAPGLEGGEPFRHVAVLAGSPGRE